VGEVTVFLEGPEEPASDAFAATVEAILPPDEFGFRRYRLRDEARAERTLVFRAPGDSLPVEPDGTYDFRVETVPGTPTPCAVVVSDETGLLYAGVADYAPGDRVLLEGLAGWDIRLLEVDCEDRGREPCFADERNVALRILHDGEQRTLMHGEQATLGAVTVRCLDARILAYSGNCPDFAEFGTGYTLRREP
jgi:hypothetical protein